MNMPKEWIKELSDQVKSFMKKRSKHDIDRSISNAKRYARLKKYKRCPRCTNFVVDKHTYCPVCREKARLERAFNNLIKGKKRS